jgi:hypothetical protein
MRVSTSGVKRKNRTTRKWVYWGFAQQTFIFGFVSERVKQFIAWSQRVFVCGEYEDNMQKLVKRGNVNIL